MVFFGKCLDTTLRNFSSPAEIGINCLICVGVSVNSALIGVCTNSTLEVALSQANKISISDLEHKLATSNIPSSHYPRLGFIPLR